MRRYTILTLLMVVIMCSNTITVFADTKSDLKILLGIAIDQDGKVVYAEDSELEAILSKIERIEYKNNQTRMLELSKQIVANEGISLAEKLESLDKEMKILVDAYTESFTSNQHPEVVLETLEKIRELESAMDYGQAQTATNFQLSDYIDPTPWEAEYYRLVENNEILSKETDIGSVKDGLLWPLNSNIYITSLYGLRRDPFEPEIYRWHRGLDIAAPMGTDILAQLNGVVSRVYTTETGGKSVEIIHTDGLITRYLHQSRTVVSPGQQVVQYQKIGEVGSTGRSTGPHLHIELIIDGTHYNPIALYGEAGRDALEKYLEGRQEYYAELNSGTTTPENENSTKTTYDSQIETFYDGDDYEEGEYIEIKLDENSVLEHIGIIKEKE